MDSSAKYLPAPEPSLTFHGSEGPVTSLCYVASGALSGHLFSGSLHACAYLWDVAGLKRLKYSFRCIPEAPKNTSVLWTHPELSKTDHVTVQLRSGILQKWIMAEGAPTCLQSVNLGEQHGFCPGAAIDGDGLVCLPGLGASHQSGLVVMDEKSLSPVGAFVTEENHFTPMKMACFDDHQLLVAYEDAVLLLWDVRAQKEPIFETDVFRTKESAPGNGGDVKKEMATPMALDIERGKGTGVIGFSTDVVHRFDISPSGILLRGSIKLTEEGVSEVRIREDGKILTVTSWDYTVRIYSWRTLKSLAVIDMHKDIVQRVEYATLDGINCVILGGKDELISVWPMY